MTSDDLAEQGIDPKIFWSVIGCRAAGVAIVTVQGGDGPLGFLALSATHLTASPPTITVSLDAKTSAGRDILASRTFAVNYLSAEGGAIYEKFSQRDGPKGPARFQGLAVKQLLTGSPVFQQITGVLDCQLEEVIDRHNTHILIGKIVAFENYRDRRPLVHYQGSLLA